MNKTLAVKKSVVHLNPWGKLRQFTNARIGIGRAGTSIPTHELLQFQLSHGQAIDAVHAPLNIELLCEQFNKSELLQPYLPVTVLQSKACNRMEYLQRPDLGRQLNEVSLYKLQEQSTEKAYDLVFVIADGLSSYAIAHHATPFLEALVLRLNQIKPWRIAPIYIVEQGRVAVGDDICEALNAKEVIVLIGERPGLSSPDSMGLYLTWDAKQRKGDSSRNCISNIRPQGLNYEAAANKCSYLISESQRIELTGVSLKDRSEDIPLENNSTDTFSLTHNR